MDHFDFRDLADALDALVLLLARDDGQARYQLRARGTGWRIEAAEPCEFGIKGETREDARTRGG